jgi:hypothetical protein
MTVEPEQVEVLTAKDLYRRRKTRNLALVVVIFGLSALFYVVTILKVSQ